MTFQTGVTEFAEFVGSEIRRIEKKIPTDGGGQSSDSTIITGNGRPDKPDTTDGKITGREPNGSFYYSTNGAGVGAYLWQKQNNKWIVISGDTGPRRMGNSSVNIKEGAIYLRRMNNRVECSFNTGRWDTISFYGSSNPKFTRKNHAKRMDILPSPRIPVGFRTKTPIMLPFYSDDGDEVAVVYVASIGDRAYIELRFKDKVPTSDLDYMRMPVISWITDDPFPETLP
ncbi:hypothetical protein HMPREF3279_02865 [Haemophilus sp. HMSC71H05]|uniref:hypothetical protein n=1 Tax=Haemophilus sp. HMSC71H05 TaxID=1608898 RepID=UPI0008A96C75|nr:hypothetical protein [Haemophilus sp. HMSC71H05]OHR69627.1 hypothetical protein HMPREF3279_02865 [Haemophilus sp. HMSC71H05]